eukprot:TRINITY_DN35605_c0_g1_i1.p1 TRINITY_DN35605_c0_g1~~TRINITY_DN35605_c0_g1_i1.p1  ORF type:complete len:118 (-),score=27.22 TRINITY_DN35605_c0_g1_i1:12-365(-)
MVQVHIELEDGDFALDVAASSTNHELKKAIHQETGVVPVEQTLRCLGFPLEEEEAKIAEFLELSKTFNLVLPDEDADKGILEGNLSSLVTRCIHSHWRSLNSSQSRCKGFPCEHLQC